MDRGRARGESTLGGFFSKQTLTNASVRSVTLFATRHFLAGEAAALPAGAASGLSCKCLCFPDADGLPALFSVCSRWSSFFQPVPPPSPSPSPCHSCSLVSSLAPRRRRAPYCSPPVVGPAARLPTRRVFVTVMHKIPLRRRMFGFLIALSCCSARLGPATLRGAVRAHSLSCPPAGILLNPRVYSRRFIRPSTRKH